MTTYPCKENVEEPTDGMEGEKLRQRLGIDGTMGDAQDVPHEAHPSLIGPWCAVCGLSTPARIHRKPRTENVEEQTDG